MIRFTEAFVVLVVTLYASASMARPASQRAYPTAEDAAKALFQAVQAGDEGELSQVLGGDAALFSAGDKSEDRLDRQKFLEKYREMHRLVREPEGTVLYVGAENWPFPVPLTNDGGGWSFDAKAGLDEIRFRRIGANESFAIDACQRLAGANGGDVSSLIGNQVPAHGYFFRAVSTPGQPPSFVAYPAEYRSSGLMTFVADHGLVYERDLGPQTTKVASTMTRYKPDPAWQLLQ